MNSIQAIRNVYDIAKNAKLNNQPMSDDEIKLLLERTVPNQALIPEFQRFQRGYAAEDLFLRVFSALPWVISIVPLGQEQFPAKSKEKYRFPIMKLHLRQEAKRTLPALW